MRPELFRIPWVDWPIRSYGVLIVIGFLLATWLASREARRRGLPEVVYDLGVVMLICGLVGGRFFYFLQFYDRDFANQPWELFYIWKGGLVFYGGGIAGALGGFIFLIVKKLPAVDLYDAVAPFIPVAMGFGRLGCFLNGCCWGARCSGEFPLAVRYPRPEHPEIAIGPHGDQVSHGLISPEAPYSLPVYPVQVFETAFDFILCGLLWWYLRGPSPRGGGLPLLFVTYGVGRFLLEGLRGDNQPWLASLTISQVVSIALIGLFLPLFLYRWRQGVRIPGRHPQIESRPA